MSNRKIRTKLKGYEGPFFPKELSSVQKKLYREKSSNFNGYSIEQALNTIEIFCSIKLDVYTDDGYAWFWAARFRVGLDEILLLFPWGQDWNKSDDTTSDRHMALYTKKKMSGRYLNQLCREVGHAWNNYSAKAEKAA